MRLILLKSAKIANQAGYYLLNGRWHSIKQHKPAPKGAPQAAHPHAAGAPVQKETLAESEWEQLKLPAENVNSGTFNKQLGQLQAAASAGDVTGILASGFGTNTYGKKLAIIANHVLGLLGSDHKVTPGQKAGDHAAVQTAPEIEAGKPAPAPAEPKPAPAPEPEKPAPKEAEPAPQQDAPAPAQKPASVDDLKVPEFAEGKMSKGVKVHYEKEAKKIIVLAKTGDLAALQFMVKPDKGQSWKGKTDNSKKLLALHDQAVAALGGIKSSKEVVHPDAAKQAKQEEKELAKEHVTPEPKPEPKPQPEKPQPEKPVAQPAGGKALTSQQAKLIDGIEKYLGLKLSGAAYVKNNVVNIDTDGLQQHNLHAIENYGKQFGKFSMEPGGHKKFSLVMPKQTAKPEPENKPEPKPAPAEKSAPEPKKFKNYSWKAIELAKHYTIPELEAAMKDVESEHKGTGTGMQLYDKAGQKKLDALTWAITHIAAAEKKAKANAPKPEAQGPKEGETKEGADGTLVFKDGRWHKQGEAKPAEDKAALQAKAKAAAAKIDPEAAAIAKEAVTADAKSKLSQIPWDSLLLPAENKNSKSHNGKVAHIKAMAEAGDIEGLKAFKAGVNTYGKKQNLLAQTALAALEEGAAAAPVAEAKPAEKTVPPLPAFKTAKEIEDWSDTSDFHAWNNAGIEKYGSKEAWSKAPESKEFDDLYVNLPNSIDQKAPPEPKQPEAKSPAGDMPKQPKIKDFNTDMVAKLWQKMAQSGNTAGLMASIEKLAQNAKKKPQSFTSDDAQALLGYAKEMAKWVSSSAPAPEPTDGKPVKPTGLTSVGWTAVVKDIEAKMEAKDVFPIAQHAKQTEGLTSDEAKQVHAYANAAVKYLFDKAAKDFPLDNDGPKDGDTKQGANGQLVFKDGRWHKVGEEVAQEKPAPAADAHPVDAIPVPDFSEFNNPAKMVQAIDHLKDKIKSEGASAMTGVMKHMKATDKQIMKLPLPNGQKYTVNAFGGNPDSKYGKLWQYLEALKAATGKPKPKPKAAPVQSDPEPAKDIESMDSWQQTGGQGGSNPGGKFKDADGVEWYCKFPGDEDMAKAEVTAAKLYSALGLQAQDAKLITKGGKLGIASRWVDVKKASAAELKKAPGVIEGFAADAWLANWDVVGMELDNLQLDSAGYAMRVDAGGSLMYRAQGGKKAFGDQVAELDTLRDAALNPQSASVFGKMTKADITASVAKVAQLSDAKIRIIVSQNGPGTKEERKALADTLIARKNDLISKFPKAAKVPKKRLDPNNLPVDPERLPKAHDFANWNGPGSGLSSQGHINEANQKVEQQMMDVAKSGNLTELKDFKFEAVDKTTGKGTGQMVPIDQHPSKHVIQLHSDLVQLLDEIANPPQPLKIFQEADVGSVEELEAAFPPKKFGTTVNQVHSNEKLGFWVVLGGAHGAENFKPKKTMAFAKAAVEAAYTKYKQASKLAKHFINSVQASGSYNDLFRDGKEFDHQGNKLSDVAKAAMEFATEQPEGTSLYRWQNMSDDMVKKILSAPDGSVFQATGPMCTSFSPTATNHFGKHRVTFFYAKGAKAVESFGSGAFSGEKEITTLPNSRFVILSKKMVPDDIKHGKERLELEVLMLPPDLGV